MRNEDIVIRHTSGSTQHPRIEDWPVMPPEKMVVGLKLVNSRTGNPNLDIAVSTKKGNRRVLVEGPRIRGDD